jgi:hypothetical protein
MKNQKITSKQLTNFGEFLRLGYSENTDLAALADHLTTIVADLDASIYLMRENRILTNVAALIVENPDLLMLLDPDTKALFKSIYMENWRDSELIKRQLVELSDAMQQSSTSPILMIKGGLRLFDDLYPSPIHRYLADVDLYFENSDILPILAALGYQSDDISDFDLQGVTEEFLVWHKTQKHHLPRLGRVDRPRVFEMHQHMVHLRASPYCRGGELSHSNGIPALPKIMAPNLVDQLILNILHATYGDRFSFYANFRLRNIFEGYLLYNRLTGAQRTEFYEHFDRINRRQDIEFWKYLCFKFFNAKEFSGHFSLSVKFKFFLHKQFGQNPKANAIIYSCYFIYRLIFKDLWSSKARSILWNKLTDNSRRHLFFQKITRIFKN